MDAYQRAVPVLQVANVETSLRWYIDVFGFAPDTFPKSPPYSFAMLRRDGAEIMLQCSQETQAASSFERKSDPEFLWSVYLRVAGAAVLDHPENDRTHHHRSSIAGEVPAGAAVQDQDALVVEEPPEIEGCVARTDAEGGTGEDCAQDALVNQLDAAVKADQAAIDNAKVQLAYTTVVAPIDGRTGIRLVDAGNIVHAYDANGIVVITQLRPISLLFTLPEQNLAEIQAHLSAGEPLSVLAVDRDNNKTLSEGKLAVVDNQIDTTTGTLRLKATFPNDNLRLWPGQFVNARLLLATRKDGIVVPAQVIQRGPEGTYAFVIDDDMSAQVRPVKVARIDQEQALIDDGLRPGERVVVDGQYKLQPGSQVKLSDSTPPNPANRRRTAGKPAEAKEGP